jgi:hypothetical protein
MPVRTINYDTAKSIGYDISITEIAYKGPLNEYDDFCNYVRLKFPNLKSFTVNVPVDHIPDNLMYRLEKVDCSHTNIKKLRYGPNIKCVIAVNTDIKLDDILSLDRSISYLKIGRVGDGTRVTIDSHSEFLEFSKNE